MNLIVNNCMNFRLSPQEKQRILFDKLLADLIDTLGMSHNPEKHQGLYSELEVECEIRRTAHESGMVSISIAPIGDRQIDALRCITQDLWDMLRLCGHAALDNVEVQAWCNRASSFLQGRGIKTDISTKI